MPRVMTEEDKKRHSIERDCCESNNDFYSCTLKKDHTGKHEAAGTKLLYAEWEENGELIKL